MLRLKQLRKEAGKNQQALADFLGVGRTTITHWESGFRQPDNETLGRLATYFGVSVDYLLGRTDEPGMDAEDNPTNTVYLLGRSGQRDKLVLTEEQAKKARDVLKAMFPEKFKDQTNPDE